MAADILCNSQHALASAIWLLATRGMAIDEAGDIAKLGWFQWIEARFPWRGFLQDWMASAIAAGSYVILSIAVSGATLSLPLLVASTPQLLLSMALYPIIAAMVALLDRFRLIRIREVRGWSSAVRGLT